MWTAFACGLLLLFMVLFSTNSSSLSFESSFLLRGQLEDNEHLAVRGPGAPIWTISANPRRSSNNDLEGGVFRRYILFFNRKKLGYVNDGMTDVCTIRLRVNHSQSRWVDAKKRGINISCLITLNLSQRHGLYVRYLLSSAHPLPCEGTRNASYSAWSQSTHQAPSVGAFMNWRKNV